MSNNLMKLLEARLLGILIPRPVFCSHPRLLHGSNAFYNVPQVVTVSRDGHGYVWELKDGKKVCELAFSAPGRSAEKYLFRACR